MSEKIDFCLSSHGFWSPSLSFLGNQTAVPSICVTQQEITSLPGRGKQRKMLKGDKHRGSQEALRAEQGPTNPDLRR